MKKIKTVLILLLFAGYLGLHGGNIAIYENGKEEPTKIFPYQAEALPPDARAALEKGIPFNDMQKLSGILESYLP